VADVAVEGLGQCCFCAVSLEEMALGWLTSQWFGVNKSVVRKVEV
jgi:hypothetical protein